MIKYILLLTALLGSVLGYYIINLMIVPVSVFEYLGIEGVITIFHSIYNKLKNNIEVTPSN
jgi:hypothetical protein